MSLACSCAPAQQERISRQADGLLIRAQNEVLRIQVVSHTIFHVQAAPARSGESAFTSHPSLTIVPQNAVRPYFDTEVHGDTATLSTAHVRASIELRTGAVSFTDRMTGAPVLGEGVRTFAPARVQGADTINVRQQWLPLANESLFGLGQQQLGILDLKGFDLDLWQHNTNVYVPFLALLQISGLDG